jgi:arginase family enzyme
MAGSSWAPPPRVPAMGVSTSGWTRSQIVHLPSDQLHTPDALIDAVAGIAPEITGLYVHLDLDVLDASIAHVNVYNSPNGPDGDQLDALVAALLRRFPVRALSLTAYDLAFDSEDRVPPIAFESCEQSPKVSD